MSSTGARERRCVRAACAIVALGIADHAFLRPQPGTGAGDHLASGLVPLAVLALFAAAYPALRPGVRGAAALVVGVLSTLAAIADPGIAAALAGFAGLGLACVGVATLWRGRRRDERPLRRYVRRGLVAFAAGVVTLYVVVPIGVAIVATHRDRDVVPVGRPFARVTLRTGDGLRLAAWYAPSRNGAAVVVFPGKPLAHAQMLVRHGYGVLLLDRRGEGESEGDFNAYGWAGEADLRAAIAFLRRRPDVDGDRIGGLGLSVGGELLLQTAAHDRSLRAVVSEGAGARSLGEQLERPGVPAWRRPVSPWLVETGALAVLGNASPPPALGELVRDIRQPVLLIQARDGHEDEALNAVYQARAEAASRWVVPSGGHTGALAAYPGEYERRVVAFFAQALS